MGSLTGTVPTNIPTPQLSVQAESKTGQDTATQNTSAEENDTRISAAQLRQENLLQRSRGRFGTILTGFRGLLDTSDNANASRTPRKTLLGE